MPTAHIDSHIQKSASWSKSAADLFAADNLLTDLLQADSHVLDASCCNENYVNSDFHRFDET